MIMIICDKVKGGKQRSIQNGKPYVNEGGKRNDNKIYILICITNYKDDPFISACHYTTQVIGISADIVVRFSHFLTSFFIGFVLLGGEGVRVLVSAYVFFGLCLCLCMCGLCGCYIFVLFCFLLYIHDEIVSHAVVCAVCVCTLKFNAISKCADEQVLPGKHSCIPFYTLHSFPCTHTCIHTHIDFGADVQCSDVMVYCCECVQNCHSGMVAVPFFIHAHAPVCVYKYKYKYI